MSAATLSRVTNEGYVVALEGGRLKVRGDAPPPEELRTLIAENRDALKAAVLLSDPPDWLAKLLKLYLSGRETEVRREDPATGKAKVFGVRVSVKNICAAVAAEIGTPVLEWEHLRPEVEEALERWSK